MSLTYHCSGLSFSTCFVASLEKLNSVLDSVKELIVNVSVCVCQALLYLGQSVSLLGLVKLCSKFPPLFYSFIPKF